MVIRSPVYPLPESRTRIRTGGTYPPRPPQLRQNLGQHKSLAVNRGAHVSRSNISTRLNRAVKLLQEPLDARFNCLTQNPQTKG